MDGAGQRVGGEGESRLVSALNIFLFFAGLWRPPPSGSRSVQAMIGLQGRCLGASDLKQIRQWVAEHPDWSRYRLSQELCAAWNWRNGVGQLKDMAARTLLLKLAQRGWVRLPPPRGPSPHRHRLRSAAPRRWDQQTVTARLADLRPLQVQEVSREPEARAEVKAALATFHYLGYRLPVGENLQYAVRDGGGRLLAVLVWGAAAWKCAPRDHWIGWGPRQREQGLVQLANNSRLLILPWVQVPHLASWLLGQVARRITVDWQAKYGHGVVLLETFVERARFAGTCYRAANWRPVGVTCGRSRQDRERRLQVPVKDIYLYPLRADFREVLCP